MGIISRIVSGLANPGIPEPEPHAAVEPEDSEEPAETEAERRRRIRIQDALFNSDERHGFVARWPLR